LRFNEKNNLNIKKKKNKIKLFRYKRIFLYRYCYFNNDYFYLLISTNSIFIKTFFFFFFFFFFKNKKILGDNDYYLVSKEENYALGEDHGALFYCDPEKQKPICTEIFDVGYYIKDKEAIFSCKAGNNGLDCSLNKLTDENNACNTNSIGKPFLNQNKLALCLDYDEGATTAYAIDLTPTTSGNYLIKKDSSNLFDIPSDRDYAIVSVKEKIITINLNYTNKLKYVYANKDAKMKLLEKGDTCPKSNGALDETKILELNCVNSKCTTNLNLS